jgi:hypothetical protein
VTGSAQPAPGWYPDPDGAEGMVRWWDGGRWSDVATPAGPGVAVQSSPVLAPPAPRPAPTPFPLPETAANRTPWIVGISLLVLVAVVGAALFLGRSSDGTPAAGPAVPTQPQPQAPVDPTFPPGTVRIFDQAAGISYPFLGEGWYEWGLWSQAETTSTAGQYFTTQELTPDGTTFISQCSSGPLADGFGWTGAASLPTTLAAVAESVRLHYYPAPNERTVMREEDRTVDGHPARLYEFQLAWDVPGYEATGERAALLLIDVGRPAPALLYISIPNTHAELYGAIDRVLDSVDVL